MPILCSRTKISVAARKIKIFFGQKVKLATKRRPIFFVDFLESIFGIFGRFMKIKENGKKRLA